MKTYLTTPLLHISGQMKQLIQIKLHISKNPIWQRVTTSAAKALNRDYPEQLQLYLVAKK